MPQTLNFRLPSMSKTLALSVTLKTKSLSTTSPRTWITLKFCCCFTNLISAGSCHMPRVHKLLRGTIIKRLQQFHWRHQILKSHLCSTQWWINKGRWRKLSKSLNQFAERVKFCCSHYNQRIRLRHCTHSPSKQVCFVDQEWYHLAQYDLTLP